MKHPHTLSFLLLCSLSPQVLSLQSNDACLSQANTPLETAYCNIKKSSPTLSPLSLNEFKKNSPKIQRLLLKREAKKLGIALPKADKPRVTKKKVTSKYSYPSFDNCALENAHIRCKSALYVLTPNQKNNTLKSSAFSNYNELNLPEKSATEFKDESDYLYLSHIYPKYIYKMLEIGLGDSTMSFTKFATVYWQSKEDGSNFTERFGFMYNQLKTEKSKNQIKARYTKNYPSGLHLCMRLDSTIIVCDDMTQNWVYKLK